MQILAIAAAIAVVCALQPILIRSAHLPLDLCRASLARCALAKWLMRRKILSPYRYEWGAYRKEYACNEQLEDRL